MVNKHECYELESKENYYSLNNISMEFNSDVKSWIVKYKEIADKKMVEMGEAEYEGEAILEITFPIEYCPFCGLRLGEI